MTVVSAEVRGTELASPVGPEIDVRCRVYLAVTADIRESPKYNAVFAEGSHANLSCRS